MGSNAGFTRRCAPGVYPSQSEEGLFRPQATRSLTGLGCAVESIYNGGQLADRLNHFRQGGK